MFLKLHKYPILDFVLGDQGITERSLRVVHILQSEESGLFSINKQDIDQSINLQNVEECYTEVSALVKDIMAPLGLKTCLHPSEYDRCPILLICRSEKALGNDIIGQQERLASQQKLCIPLSALSRIENVKIVKGHFTKLWKARWTTKDGKSDVAIKQLKHNDSHLQPFMHMCAQAMLWNDSTLIKIHGATLATPGNPMALVMDYLPHGPLNRFLQSHKDSVEKEDLLEAAVSLARALLHLEELYVVHGNIRLRNVLVAHYGEEGLKVKLGDPGLPDYSSSEEVHWLSFELLLDSCPTPSKCTDKGDVWAYGTTLWELFSYGDVPSLDPVFAKEQYLNGHRLPMPTSLHGKLSTIYGVMQGCWHPLTEARMAPHTILRDLNQLLYRIFNSKKVHTYVTLSQESDDLDDSSINSSTLSSPVHSAKSEETVVYLSSEFSSASSDKNLRHFVGSGNGSAGGSSISTTSMAPLFTNQMQQLFGGLGQGMFDFG